MESRGNEEEIPLSVAMRGREEGDSPDNWTRGGE